MNTPVILFIDLSRSSCGACGEETLPDGATHAQVAGYGGGGPGCGATWTHLSTHYRGTDSEVRSMRPDLPWLDPHEAMRIEHGARQERRGVVR